MSNDHAYELRELMKNLTKAYEIVGETVRKALEGLELTPEPMAWTETFRHTDSGGDSVKIGPNVHEVMMVSPGESGMPVCLDQHAVNRLSQYLDRHRTDLPKAVAGVPCHANPVQGECTACGHASHGTVGCGGRGPEGKCLCRGGSDGA